MLLGLAMLATPAWAQSSNSANPDRPAQSFQDWRLNCEAESRRCYLFQNTSVQETGQRVLGLVAGNLGPEGKSILHFTVPLGIYIPPGVAMRIDQGKQTDVPVATCTPAGCEAVVDLTSALISDLERARGMQVAFLDAVTRRQITVNVSLAGFRDGYAVLRRQLGIK